MGALAGLDAHQPGGLRRAQLQDGGQVVSNTSSRVNRSDVRARRGNCLPFTPRCADGRQRYALAGRLDKNGSDIRIFRRAPLYDGRSGSGDTSSRVDGNDMRTGRGSYLC